MSRKTRPMRSYASVSRELNAAALAYSQKRDALLRDALKEISEFHSTAYPKCEGGCPAHEILRRGKELGVTL